METITKQYLIDCIARQERRKRVEVKHIVQELLYGIIDELAKGNKIELRGFGVWKVFVRKAHTAQNPRTMQKVQVPPRRVVRFKPSLKMKQALQIKVGED